MSPNALQYACGKAFICTVAYRNKKSSVVENQWSQKMGDMCKYWGIIPRESIDVVNKINSRDKVTHAKAQTLLWFGTMNV